MQKRTPFGMLHTETVNVVLKNLICVRSIVMITVSVSTVIIISLVSIIVGLIMGVSLSRSR